MSKTAIPVFPSQPFTVSRLPDFQVPTFCNAEQVEQSANVLLESHPQFQGKSQWVKCHVTGRRLLLSGDLPSFYLKQMAQEALRGLDGVDEIVNRILVAHSGGSKPR